MGRTRQRQLNIKLTDAEMEDLKELCAWAGTGPTRLILRLMAEAKARPTSYWRWLEEVERERRYTRVWEDEDNA